MYICKKTPAMSHTNCLYHIVFNTYKRINTIPPEHQEELYRFIWSLLLQRNCRLLRINGMPNHVHLFVDLAPYHSLSDIVGELKRESSKWMKRCGNYPQFEGWGKEYFATSKSVAEKNVVIEYIKNQQEHHAKRSFEEELQEMFRSNGWEWNDYVLT